MPLTKSVKSTEPKFVPGNQSVQESSDYVGYIASMSGGWRQTNTGTHLLGNIKILPRARNQITVNLQTQPQGSALDPVSLKAMWGRAAILKSIRVNRFAQSDQIHPMGGIFRLRQHSDISEKLLSLLDTSEDLPPRQDEPRLADFYQQNAGPFSSLREPHWRLPNRPWRSLGITDENEPARYIVITREPIAYGMLANPSDPNMAIAHEPDDRQWLIPHLTSSLDQVLEDLGDQPVDQLHQVAQEFSRGANGVTPLPNVVEMVDRIIKTVIEKTSEPDYSVDDDGAVSFEAPLSDGRFIMCEVSMAGNINAGLYRGPHGGLETFLVRPTEEQLLGLF